MTSKGGHCTRELRMRVNKASERSEAGEVCGGDGFSLDEDVKAFAHTFREDEGFELETGAKAGGIVHGMVVEIGEIVSLAKSEKKSSLCDESESFETVGLSPKT